MPLFLQQSQDPPDIADKFHEPAPAPVMSRKSAFVTTTVPAVTVRDVPITLEHINTRLVIEFPLIVNVHVIVGLESNHQVCVLLAAPVIVRVQKVLAQFINNVHVVVALTVTILNVSHGAVKIAQLELLVRIIVDVHALNVRLVKEPILNAEPQFIVLAHKEIQRVVVTPKSQNVLHVTVTQLVSRVPFVTRISFEPVLKVS